MFPLGATMGANLSFNLRFLLSGNGVDFTNIARMPDIRWNRSARFEKFWSLCKCS